MFARKNAFLAAKTLGDSPLYDALDWFDLSRIHDFLVDLTHNHHGLTVAEGSP